MTNINLSNFFHQINGNNNLIETGNGKDAVHSSPIDTSAVKNAVEQIKNLLVGDIFTGEITDQSQNQITIRYGNGQFINANLLSESGSMNVNKGDMVTFLVQQKTDSMVSLKPLDGTAQEMIFANKALEASGLAKTKENLELVKNLVDLNMPIDKKTLGDMSKLMTQFPGTSTDTILRLTKLEIPVTAENVAVFDAYKAYEHDMTGTIRNLSDDFSHLMEQLVEQDTKMAPDIAGKLLEVFHPSDSFPEQESLKDEIKQRINTSLKDSNSVSDQIIEHLKDDSRSPSEKLDFLQNLLKSVNELKENDSMELSRELGKILKSKEVKEILQENLRESMFIKPEDVAEKKEVREYYKNLLKVVTQGEKVLEKAGLSESALSKGLNAVKNNVEFMNELNHQMSFLQIPVKIHNGETRGDLYVYTNRKKRLSKEDDLTALLHLDMEHLGPMDVYVKMSHGNHVSTNFCLESEEMLDFIYDHIDLLTKRLKEQGYDFNPTMTLKDPVGQIDENGHPGSIDFVRDFLDVSDPVISMNRYIFDTKA
ncbi:MAG: flagellar hook-length control protein FliK [Lachnospiraceae bacterium]